MFTPAIAKILIFGEAFEANVVCMHETEEKAPIAIWEAFQSFAKAKRLLPRHLVSLRYLVYEPLIICGF
jgi:hypothetical protein